MKLFKQTKERLAELIWDTDFEAVEFFLSFRSMVWGLWLLGPRWKQGAEFDKAYETLSKVAPEYCWGSFVFLVGLLQLISLLWGSLKIRAWVAVISTLIWLFIATIFYVSNPYSAAGPTHALTAVFNIWTCIRLWTTDEPPVEVKTGKGVNEVE